MIYFIKNILLTGYIPLFVVSTLTAAVLLLIIGAMAFLLSRFYRSSIASYNNKIQSLNLQVKDMQQHLDYASREETKAKADATRAAAARDKLLISLSHEIRTPMNGILGMAILLEETNLDTEQRDYMDTIISSGKILLNKVDEVMANDMLEQSKINSNINAVEQKSTDLHNCIEEVFENFAVKAAEKKTELLYEIEQGLPMEVLVDTKRLQQVLTNLVENVLGNAREQLCVAVQVINNNSKNVASALGFTISTKPFGNADKVELLLSTSSTLPDNNSDSEQDEKALGLGISKKLVQEIGGQICMINDSTDGFIFSIPLQAVPVHSASPGGYSLKDFEGKSVLIINNNEAAATILRNKLQQWKLLPEVATNAEQALQILPGQSFSLVITEMDLPGMNGIQLAGCIKDSYPLLPVILLNAMNDERYKLQEAVAAKINVLQKPLKQHILFDNILSCLRNKKTAQVQDVSVKNLSSAFAKKYPLRILVAEDNPVNQKWAIKILGKLGYVTDIAENGHVALDMVGKTTYDLIFMDVQMPEMDGLETTKMIRVCLSKQPTIIAMTANVMHGDRMACMQAGMDDYISKPVQLGELLNMLEKWALVITEKKNYAQVN